eukprot:357151-Chlamydomonas_euryale.AAC.2
MMGGEAGHQKVSVGGRRYNLAGAQEGVDVLGVEMTRRRGPGKGEGGGGSLQGVDILSVEPTLRRRPEKDE